MTRGTKVRAVVWSAVAALALGVAAGHAWLRRSLRASRDVLEEPAALAELHARYGPKRYSQFDEETLIRDFFHDRRGGFFLDVGSGDYKHGSTTFYLEEALGWSGVAVDANPQFAVDYALHRPRTKFFAYFVADREDDAHPFYTPGDDSQLASGSKPYAARFGLPVKETRPPATTLDALLARNGVAKVDFLSMDIEQGEPDALVGFDIGRYRPDLVCIEMQEETAPRIRAYFGAHGYDEVTRYAPLDRVNRYFAPRARR
jgi:FkbM family methyltransferase